MPDYVKARATAARLITSFGGKKNNAKLRRDGVDRNCTAVLINYTTQEREGSLIQHGDQKALVAALGLAVPPDNELDQLIMGKSATPLRIVAPPGKLDPTGDLVIFWELQVRN